jgi:hypothetical protein
MPDAHENNDILHLAAQIIPEGVTRFPELWIGKYNCELGYRDSSNQWQIIIRGDGVDDLFNQIRAQAAIEEILDFEVPETAGELLELFELMDSPEYESEDRVAELEAIFERRDIETQVKRLSERIVLSPELVRKHPEFFKSITFNVFNQANDDHVSQLADVREIGIEIRKDPKSDRFVATLKMNDWIASMVRDIGLDPNTAMIEMGRTVVPVSFFSDIDCGYWSTDKPDVDELLDTARTSLFTFYSGVVEQIGADKPQRDQVRAQLRENGALVTDKGVVGEWVLRAFDFNPDRELTWLVKEINAAGLDFVFRLDPGDPKSIYRAPMGNEGVLSAIQDSPLRSVEMPDDQLTVALARAYCSWQGIRGRALTNPHSLDLQI